MTGASSGIGEALTYALASHGASVVMSARREEVLREVHTHCQHSERHLVLPLDVAEPTMFARAVETVRSRYSRIDILVHGAGISQRATAAHTKLEVDQRIMAINYFGPVALTKHVLPSMIQHQAGHIVVISSLLGKFSAPTRSAYCASKHALHGFFDALRAEVFADGVAVTIVCPSFVNTNASRNALTGDGSPHAQLDSRTANGMAAVDCADQIVRAVERRRREVYIGGKETLAVYFSRWAPGLFSRVIRKVKLQ